MRLLFGTTPLDGHFRPLLPLARALAAAGHEVVFATEESWHPHVGAEGFAALPAGPTHAAVRAQVSATMAQMLALPPEERRLTGFPALFAEGHAPRRLPDLLDVARSWRADAIVWESGDLAAPIVAAALGVPAVHHSFGAMIPLAVLERASDAVAPLWRGKGLEPAPYAGAFGGLYVDLAPKSFAWEQPLGTSVRLRPVAAEAGTAPEWLGALEPPVVYVTMGTVHTDLAVFRSLLDGFDGDVSAVVTVGRQGDPGSLGPVPPRIRVESFVPQAGVLPSCDAVVCHGGSGTVFGALAHGLPLVLVPQAADQFDNAARCAAAGAAVVIPPDELNPGAVRKALRRVLDEPSFAAAARRLAAEIDEMGTPEQVATAVEEYVGPR